jgi:hypothetical protein
MARQWEAWLRELRAAGKGGVRLKAIDRGLPYSLAFSIPLDVSADTFTASLRISPDAADPVLESFAVNVGAYADGATIVTLSLTQVETAALPADGDLDGVEDFVFDMLRNNLRFFGGIIPITGKVTSYV